MQWKEGKKKLAVLLSAALVLSLIPTSAFTALAEWSGSWEQGKVWLENVQMKATKPQIEIDETTTIEVTAGIKSSPSDAERGTGTPSNATEIWSNNLQDQVRCTNNEGQVSIESVTQQGVITVKGVKRGKVTLTIDGIEGVSCEITVDSSNADAVAVAKTAIESGTYTNLPSSVNTEAALKDELVERINALSGVQNSGISVTAENIEVNQFTAAKDGDADNVDGTEGTFSFKVNLSKGEFAKATTDVKTGTITATGFPGQSNADAVAAAKTAIEGEDTGYYTVDQVDAENEANLKTKLAELINDISGVSATGIIVNAGNITVKKFEPAIAGDADDADGTNAEFSFVVNLQKGNIATATTTEKNGIIKATFYDKQTNREAVDAAKKAIEDKGVDYYTVDQVDAEKVENLKTKLAELIKAIPGMIDTGVTVDEGNISVSGFTAAVAGDADDKDGINGSFSFTVTLTKGTTGNGTAAIEQGTITATQFTGTTNAEAAAAAKSAIEGGTYTVEQKDAVDEEALKTALADQINALPGMKAAEITVKAEDIAVSGFTAAKEGDADNTAGTNGSFTFTVKLSKGKTTQDTDSRTGAITATQFTGTTNAEAVAAAKSAIEGGTYTVEQKDAGDEEALKTALAAQINALPGMKATEITVKAEDITVSGFKAAEAGTADIPKGTGGEFTFTVKLSKGKTSQDTAAETGKITAVPFIVTDFAFTPARITIDLSETLETEVTVTPQMSGTPTEEQKQAIAQDFRDGKFKAELTFTGQHCAQILKTTVNDEGPAVSLTIEGLAKDSATLKVSYGAISETCAVVVTESGSGPVVGAEIPEMDLGNVNAESLADQLNVNQEETPVPENAEEQINAILDTLGSSELPFEENNQSVEAMLLREKPEAAVIVLTPTIQVQSLNLGIEGENVVVKSMEAELKVEVDVDGVPLSGEETKALLQSNNVYISMSISVPERAARGNADYVRWTHFADSGKATVDNSVLEDEVTRISEDNIATVKARSFSPFMLEFVMNDNEPDADSNTGGSTVLVGQWVRANDGVRWWYRYPDGTWPAGGWAQLTWNGKRDWYYFDEKGYMVTGWITDGGLRYYLHPISDGTQGYMYTGWNLIDGKYYYFSDISDGTRGHLLVNTTTPDGVKVGADGARLP